MTRVSTSVRRPVGAGVGLVLDQLWPEPPSVVHPVALFGRLMDHVELRNYRDARVPGVVHALVGAAVGSTAGSVMRSTTAATALAVGGRALREAARDVSTALSAGDLTRARAALPALVGRDPTDLNAEEIARATIESVAENTVDAIVAPALWAAVAGPAGALAYRAVNTMDAVVGHHSTRYENYGWASARLDDVANWLPARCTAALVALVRPRATREIRWVVSHQAPAHPSPNSGVAEAAFAAALGVRVGGRNRYGDRVEDRAPLGRGRAPAPSDIEAAVRLCRDVTTALAAALGVAGAARWWSER